MAPETGALLDAIETDTTREPFERETRIMWAAADRAKVHTAERALMNRLLNHPEFELRWFAARRGERGERVVKTCVERDSETGVEDWDGQPVVSISGTLPIGCVLVRESPRQSGGHANVVTGTVLRD